MELLIEVRVAGGKWKNFDSVEASDFPTSEFFDGLLALTIVSPSGRFDVPGVGLVEWRSNCEEWQEYLATHPDAEIEDEVVVEFDPDYETYEEFERGFIMGRE